MSNLRTPARNAMRIVLAIERDLNNRRGLHLSGLDAEIRRKIRKTWVAIVKKELLEP